MYEWKLFLPSLGGRGFSPDIQLPQDLPQAPQANPLRPALLSKRALNPTISPIESKSTPPLKVFHLGEPTPGAKLSSRTPRSSRV